MPMYQQHRKFPLRNITTSAVRNILLTVHSRVTNSDRHHMAFARSPHTSPIRTFYKIARRRTSRSDVSQSEDTTLCEYVIFIILCYPECSDIFQVLLGIHITLFRVIGNRKILWSIARWECNKIIYTGTSRHKV
jgi:hypothetical protein